MSSSAPSDTLSQPLRRGRREMFTKSPPCSLLVRCGGRRAFRQIYTWKVRWVISGCHNGTACVPHQKSCISIAIHLPKDGLQGLIFKKLPRKRFLSSAMAASDASESAPVASLESNSRAEGRIQTCPWKRMVIGP